jgi:hypothetical protein
VNEHHIGQIVESMPPRHSPEPKPLAAPAVDQAPQHTAVDDTRVMQVPSDAEAHELPCFVHQYLRDFITLADQKAAFTFAASAALIAYLDSQGVAELFDTPISSWQIRAWIGIAAFILLGACALLAAGVVVPRLKGPSATGMIYWEEIRSHVDHDVYARAVEEMPRTAARVEVLRHCYVLAGICSEKYKMLDWALRIGFFGVIATAALLVVA